MATWNYESLGYHDSPNNRNLELFNTWKIKATIVALVYKK